MKKSLIALLFALALPAFAADRAIEAKYIYTVADGVIENGVILIEDGKIQKVGPASKVRIPSGAQTTQAYSAAPIPTTRTRLLSRSLSVNAANG